MKIKSIAVVLLVGAFVLSACGVPQEKMDAANDQITKLTAELAAANAKLDGLRTQSAEDQETIGNLQDDLRDEQSKRQSAENQLADYDNLLCDQTWQFVAYEAYGYRPLADYGGVPEDVLPALFVTQWQKAGPFDKTKPFTLLLWDIDRSESMALDASNDCIIVNPDIFPFGR